METNESLRLNPRDPRRLSARSFSSTSVMDDATPGTEGPTKRDQSIPQCNVVSTSHITPNSQRIAVVGSQLLYSRILYNHLGSTSHGEQWETESLKYPQAAERCKLQISPDTTNYVDIFDAKVPPTWSQSNTREQLSPLPEYHQESGERDIRWERSSPRERRGPQTPEREYSPMATKRETRHTCFRCNEKFETRSALNQHLKAAGHQLPLKNKAARCLFCQEIFPNWKTLEKHIRDKGHAYSKRGSRSRNRKRRSRSESGDERRSPKRIVSRRVSYSNRRSPRCRYSSSSSSQDSSRSRDRSPVENDHLRLVKYRDEESSTSASSRHQKSPEIVLLIPLEANVGHDLTDPRTVTKKKSRFVPKRIPVTQNRVTVLNRYFSDCASTAWNLILVDGARVPKEKMVEISDGQPEIASGTTNYCNKEEIEEAIQRLAKSLAAELAPKNPTPPAEKADKDVEEVAVTSENENRPLSTQEPSAIMELQPYCEETAVPVQSKEEQLIHSDAVHEENPNFSVEEPIRDIAPVKGKPTEETRVSTPMPEIDTESGADQLVPVTSIAPPFVQFHDDVEERLAKLFSDNSIDTKSTELPDETTYYMHFVQEAIDLCPECQFDLNLSPLVTVNVVTGDVLIDCTDCGTRTVMEGVYTHENDTA